MLINLAKSDTNGKGGDIAMNRFHGSKRHVGLRPVLLLCTLVVFMMIPMEMVRLYAQPTLSEVMKETPEEEVKEENAAMVKGPEDEFGRGTPRSSVKNYIAVIEERNFETAAEYLDLRRLPSKAKHIPGPELARQLRIVLARTIWVDFAALSDDPKGHLEDGLPVYRDRVGRIQSGDTTFDILMQHVPRGDGVSIWKFSNRTVGQIPQLYSIFANGMLEHIFPAWFFEFRMGGIYLGEWVAIVAIIAMAYLVAIALTGPIYYWIRRKETPLRTQLLQYFRRPFRLLVWVVIGRQATRMMDLSLVAQAVTDAGTIALIMFTWMAMRTVDFSFAQLVARMKKRAQHGLTVMLPPLRNVLKVVLILGVLIFWLDNVGVKVTTLLAGLGIGGLAVALAAQKSLENVIGAITLYAARPVKIGDFCRFGDKCGTVEEIGMRSTKIRTHDSTIINVPNAEFSNMQIENVSVRERTWYHPTIRLRHDTTPNQLRYILVEVRTMLYAHPMVQPDPARIRFEEFGEHSLDLGVFAFIDTHDPNRFLEVAEDLNLRIMDIIAKSGTAIAIPTQSLHIQREIGLNEEKSQAVDAQVQDWKKHNALYLPTFPQEKIDELQGSLDFPPIGSSESVDRPSQAT